MKKYVYLSVQIIALLFASSITCYASLNAETNKIQTSLEQIILSDEGIFLNLDGDIHQIAGVIEEDGEFYALPSPNIWYCNYCGVHNFYGTKKCGRCGKSREETGS